MAFDLEITFSGLCVFLIQGDVKQPGNVEVALVDARDANGGCHVHRPLLSYRPENVEDPTHDATVVGAGGEQYAQRELSGRVLSLDATSNDGSCLKVKRKDDAGNKPADRGQDVYFNWVPTYETLGLAASDLKDGVLGGGIIPGAVASRFRFPGQKGEISAKGVARWKNAGPDPIVWKFKKNDDTVVASHALAGFAVWTVRNLEGAVTLQGAREDLVLKPHFESPRKLEISVTNLPPTHGVVDPVKLEHFHCFYRLAEEDPAGGRRIPYREPAQTGGSVICPVATVNYE